MTPAELAHLAAATTPGPWQVHRESDGARVTYYGMTVAWCGTSLAMSREGRWEISREQAHANADLFAAVPDLLAALDDAEADRDTWHATANDLGDERDRLRERVKLAEAWLEAEDTAYRKHIDPDRRAMREINSAREAFRASKGGE